MPLIRTPASWQLPEAAATPESVYLRRRDLLRALGLGSITAVLPSCYLKYEPGEGEPQAPHSGRCGEETYSPPPERNNLYTVPERCMTPERTATRFNNFYEFTQNKSEVWSMVDNFQISPWTLQVGGLVNRPTTFDIDELERRFGVEERIYRFRCVEAWAMTVPWRGFPLAKLLAYVEPTSEARFVKMTTASQPENMPEVRKRAWWAPWPYTEGMRLDEAMNVLAFMVTGLYGKPLPKQSGAPIRLALPWKYGFKSVKSIVSIELTAEQPATFWNHVWPEAYAFEANVDPSVPHPRWSQERERLIESGRLVDTQLFNGYGEQVAALYR